MCVRGPAFTDVACGPVPKVQDESRRERSRESTSTPSVIDSIYETRWIRTHW